MENKFTHLAEIYGFRCYFNADTYEIQGTNWFNDFMIELFAYVAAYILQHEGFNIKLIKEL